MTYNVFIDGEAGTTGLQVQGRLSAHPDVRLIAIDHDLRKDNHARRDAMAAADVAILCLPDEAAIEAASLAEGLGVKIIDASTAYRTHPDWAYGFPELDGNQRDKIANSNRVSNVGCYASAMIALIRPLVDAGVIDDNLALNISAISGYTGGGKTLISYMENDEGPKHFAYALGLNHKHIPEVMMHGRLQQKPSFLPMVGDFDCGMLVQMPLHLNQLAKSITRADLHAVYASHYDGEAFVKTCALDASHGLTDKGYLAADALKGTNLMELHCLGNDDQVMMVARLDNLGKGASGAAVQNLNILLGVDEKTGLI